MECFEQSKRGFNDTYESIGVQGGKIYAEPRLAVEQMRIILIALEYELIRINNLNVEDLRSEQITRSLIKRVKKILGNPGIVGEGLK